MGISTSIALVGIGLAMAAGMCTVVGLARAGRGVGTFVGDVIGGDHSRMRWRVRNGVRFLHPLCRRFLSLAPVDEVCDQAVAWLDEKGYPTTKPALLSLVLLAMVVSSLAGALATSSIAGGCAIGFIVPLVFFAFIRNRTERIVMQMRESIPDALRAMSVCFKSGYSLQQTLGHVANEAKHPLDDVFLSSVRLLETGASTSEALAPFSTSAAAPELAFIAVALDVQHQSGGSLAPVLDAARESVEGELDLLRSLRIQTTQAKLSARIVTLMPFVLVALFSLVSENFLAPFFSSPFGMALLGVALAMQAAGVVIVHRMLRIEVD